MAGRSGLNAGGFLLRLIVAVFLVFITFNPSGTSYFHWVQSTAGQIAPEKAFAGVVLLILWLVYLRAAFTSLGLPGLLLTAAFFGTLLWLIIDRGIISVESRDTVVYLVEAILALVLAVGVSWSHLRRKLTGQVDTDPV